MKLISLNPNLLDCLNLYGLSLGFNGKPDKLAGLLKVYIANSNNSREIDKVSLRTSPVEKNRYLLLHGHHRSFSSYVLDEPILGIVYDNPEEIKNDDIARLNFDRAVSWHNMASLLHLGTIPELINEQLFDNYINYLESKSNELKEVIESLYKFKKRVNL